MRTTLSLTLAEVNELVPDEETSYQEFRICTGYSEEEYMTLGGRQSSLTEAQQRSWVYKAYKDYLAYLASIPAVDPAFYDLNVHQFFARIVVDESQDLSYLQLRILRDLVIDNAIACCMDSHQSLQDLLSKRPFLRILFGPEVSRIELDVTYRCPLRVIDAANIVIALKQSLVGGKSDKAELSKIKASDETDREGQVILLQTEEILTNSWLMDQAKGTHLAIITTVELLEEAKKLFNTPLVFTVAQIKGLEYQTIIAYRLCRQDMFKAIMQELPDGFANLEEKHHRAKAGAGHLGFAPHLNQIFTAYTRALDTLVICETPTKYTQAFLDTLRIINQPVMKEDVLDTLPIDDNWEDEARKHYTRGNHQQAKDIFINQLGGEEKDFETFFTPESRPETKPAVAIELALSHAQVVEKKPSPPQSKKTKENTKSKTEGSPKVVRVEKTSLVSKEVARLIKDFNSQNLLAVVQQYSVDKDFFLTPVTVGNKTWDSLFEYISADNTRTELLLSDEYFRGKAKSTKMFLAKIQEREKQKKLDEAVKDRLLRTLLACNTHLNREKYVVDWFKQTINKSAKESQNVSLFYWLCHLGAWKFLKEQLRVNPKLVLEIPVEMWTELNFYDELHPNLSPLFRMARSQEGQEFLSLILDKKPEILTGFSGNAWGLEHKLTGETPLFWLVFSMQSRAHFDRLIREIPNFLKSIPTETWFRHLPAEDLSFVKIFPLYSIVAGATIETLQYMLDTIPELFLAIPESLWSREIDSAGMTLLYALSLKPAFISYWLKMHPQSFRLIPPEALALQRPISVRAHANISPLFNLTNSADGVDVLKTMLILMPEMINAIPSRAWFSPASPTTGISATSSPLSRLAETKWGRNFLKMWLDTQPESFLAINPGIWGIPRSLPVCVANTSPLYWFAATDDGLDLLEDMIEKVPEVIQGISDRAFWLKRTVEAGDDVNFSAFYSFISSKKGLRVFKKILEIKPGLIDTMPPELLGLSCKDPITSENISPLFRLTESEVGLDIFRMLLQRKPELIAAVPAGAWNRIVDLDFKHQMAGENHAGFNFFKELFEPKSGIPSVLDTSQMTCIKDIKTPLNNLLNNSDGQDILLQLKEILTQDKEIANVIDGLLQTYEGGCSTVTYVP